MTGEETSDTAAGGGDQQRFLTLNQVAGLLALGRSQVYALVRRDELLTLRFGGRGQWRVERQALEDFVERTRSWIAKQPFTGDDRDEIGDAGVAAVSVEDPPEPPAESQDAS